jgi:hypothetical protein
MVHLSKLQSAHAQLNSGGENLSNKMLAYAMTIALPESWSTQKQSLRLQEPLSSESVASAVRAEWQRGVLESGGTGIALKGKGNRPQQFNNQRSNSGPNNNDNRDFPRDNNAYCDFHHMKGHYTETCFSRKRAEANKAKNKPQAKIAQAEDVPTTRTAPDTSLQPSPLLNPSPAFLSSTLARLTTW